MSQLETYAHPNDDVILPLSGSMPWTGWMEPGILVRHKLRERSLGLLIANGNDFLVVLWSRQMGVRVKPIAEDVFDVWTEGQ